jgi:hypothetical protein
MPRSKRTKSPKDGPFLFEHPLSGVDRDILRAAFSDQAKERAEAFPSLLEKGIALLKARSPTAILAITASYGLQVGVTSKEVGSNSLAGGQVGQHHIEILQALALALPADEWGAEFALPLHIQEAFDVAKELSDAFHLRRHAEINAIKDQDELTLRSIQERLRMHTQIVRNWGYFSDVVAISRSLHQPLDEVLKAKFGLTATEIVDLFVRLMRTIEERSTSRFKMLQRVFRERKPKKMIRAYYKANPQLKDGPDELIRHLGDRLHNRDEILAIILSHSDLAIPDMMIFSVGELAAASGFDEESVRTVMCRLSLAPGDLKDANPEHFFMANPVWERPLVSLGADQFLCVMPQLFFSFVHEIMESLAAEMGLATRLEARRADYLEGECERLITETVPDAKVVPSYKWEWDGRGYETDLIAAFDQYLLIVEAKSGMITAPALRGAADRAKRHIRELVIHPSEQSARLEGVVRKAQEGDETALAQVVGLGFNIGKIRHILRLSVTLSDFNVLTAQESTFKDLRWLAKDHELAVNMNIADLRCVLDLLRPMPHLISYLADRGRLQRTLRIDGDELDWLGLYLGTGFNFGQMEKVEGLVITGMSQPVDTYYNSRDAGLAPHKPMPRLTPLWADALAYMTKRKFEGWIACAVALLQAASYDEQQNVEREFKKICGRVPQVWHQDGHINSIILTPPTQRETAVIFFAYPQQLAGKRHESAANLATHSFDQSHIQKAIIFGRQLPTAAAPVSFVAMYTRSGNDLSHK